jgi:probable rRNA maturation factor
VSAALTLRNRQRARAVDLRRLRAVATWLLADLLGLESFDLGIYLVSASEIAGLNEMYLRHQGSTDVITFDYAAALPAPKRRKAAPRPPQLHGEIFICLEEAVVQARRFRTTWPSELTRYLVHGLLHLQGYDDLRASDRRRMKQREGRLLRVLSRRFDLQQLAR